MKDSKRFTINNNSRICGICGIRLNEENTGDLGALQPYCNNCTELDNKMAEAMSDQCIENNNEFALIAEDISNIEFRLNSIENNLQAILESLIEFDKKTKIIVNLIEKICK